MSGTHPTDPPSDPPARSLRDRWHSWLRRTSRIRRSVLAVAAVGTVLGGLAGYLNAYRTVRDISSPAARPGTLPEEARPASPQEPTAVLVLPLSNQTGDPDRAHVGEALSLAVSEDLVAEGVLPVVPPLSAQELAGRGLSLESLATTARVRYVLRGGVTAEGARIRVSVTLADTLKAREIWSSQLEGQAHQLLKLQDELSAQVRTQVLPRMVTEVARSRSNPVTANAKLESLLQRERALAYQPHSLALQREAERLGREALALAPDDPRALEAVAKAMWLQVENHGSEMGLDAAARAARLREAAVLARRARSAGSDSVTIEHVLSDDALARGDLEGAERYLVTAIQRRPKDVNSHHNLATLLERTGRLEEAIERIGIAAALPYYRPPLYAWTALAWYHLFAGRPEEATAWARRAVSEDPESPATHGILALARAAANDVPGARAAAARARAIRPGYHIDVGDFRPWIGREAEFKHMVQTILLPAITSSGLAAVR